MYSASSGAAEEWVYSEVGILLWGLFVVVLYFRRRGCELSDIFRWYVSEVLDYYIVKFYNGTGDDKFKIDAAIIFI